jgi:hypothetical protein
MASKERLSLWSLFGLGIWSIDQGRTVFVVTVDECHPVMILDEYIVRE